MGPKRNLLVTFLAAVVLAVLVNADKGHHEEVSPSFVIENMKLSSDRPRSGRDLTVAASTVVLVPSTTEGPYFATVSDYLNDADMTDGAKAGATGVTSNRNSVLNGIPLQLTINLYSVTGSVGTELAGATVYLWHCDAIGVYSSASDSSNQENTVGQHWLRSYLVSGSDGKVVFNTIVPGYYTGRAVHMHVRVHLASASSATTFAATTQFFIPMTIVNAAAAISPYSSSTSTITQLSNDGIYTQISSSVRSSMVLTMVGSTSSGYTAAFNLGIEGASTATLSPVAGSSTASPTTKAPTGRPTSKSPTSKAPTLSSAPTGFPTKSPVNICNVDGGVSKKVCANRISRGCDLKWFGNGCKGLTDGGCRSSSYCGFTCKKRCVARSICAWDGNACGLAS